MGQIKTIIRTGNWSPDWGYSLEASASMAKNPPHTNRDSGTNYHITGSTIINNYFLSASLVQIVTSSLGLGPANTSAKVAIPISYLGFESNVNNNQIQGIKILSYNGVKETIKNATHLSSSIDTITIPESTRIADGLTFVTPARTYNITSSFVILHISASKNDMGLIASNDLVISLGTQQLNNITPNRDLGTYTENGILVSGSHQAFAAKYPTNKSDWNLINGNLTSPKNQ